MATDTLQQERREDCRRDVLRYLAERQAVAHHPNTIRNRLNAGHQNDYSIDEIEAGLAFLVTTDPKLVNAVPEPMGATKYYQATAAGVVASERRA